MGLNNTYVYRHRRLDNNKIFYIGIGKKRRAYAAAGRNNIWKKIVNKTDYKIEIIQENLSREDANELEIFLISIYGRIDINTGTLANMTDGGDGGLKVVISQERRKKVSEFHKGKLSSDKTKLKMRNSQLGKKTSEKTKLKQSLLKGRRVFCCLSLKEWRSIKECANENNINYSSLSKKIHGSRKNNTTFKYLENDK